MRWQYLARGPGFAHDFDETADLKPQVVHVIRVQAGHHPTHIPGRSLGDLETKVNGVQIRLIYVGSRTVDSSGIWNDEISAT